MVIPFFCTGLCIVTSITPPNGTEVTREIGALNVTFECIVTDYQGMQDVTQWNIENFRGNPGAQFITIALRDTILEGEPTNGGVFATFRTRLIFPVFLKDLDRTTLTCGLPPSIREGQFILRANSKSLCGIPRSLHAKKGITFLFSSFRSPSPLPSSFNPPPPPPPPPPSSLPI